MPSWFSLVCSFWLWPASLISTSLKTCVTRGYLFALDFFLSPLSPQLLDVVCFFLLQVVAEARLFRPLPVLQLPDHLGLYVGQLANYGLLLYGLLCQRDLCRHFRKLARVCPLVARDAHLVCFSLELLLSRGYLHDFFVPVHQQAHRAQVFEVHDDAQLAELAEHVALAVQLVDRVEGVEDAHVALLGFLYGVLYDVRERHHGLADEPVLCQPVAMPGFQQQLFFSG